LNLILNYGGSSGIIFCAAADGNVGLCDWDTECIDLANDPLHCGYLGVGCPAGRSCSHGVCSGTPPECGLGRIGAYCNLDAGLGFICCPGVGCIDVETDVANCGFCQNACDAGQSCVAGTCQ
jgi:hypothetical protein